MPTIPRGLVSLLFAGAGCSLFGLGLRAEGPAALAGGPRYATALLPEDIGPEALAVAPSDLQLSPEGEARAEALARFAEGILLEDAGESERALEAYLASLERDPSNADLAVRVAYELSQTDQVPRAIRILRDAVAASPRAALAHLQLAWIYARQVGRPELALRHVQSALEIDPGDADAIEAQVQILAESGQLAKAQAALDRAARARDREPDYWVRLAEMQIRLTRPDPSKTPSAQGLKRAEVALRRAEESASARPDLLERIGDLHLTLDRLEPAVACYRAALEVCNEYRLPGPLREKLARTLAASGRLAEAAEELQCLIRDDPTRAELYELLGGIREELGDLTGAILQFEQVVLLNPGLPAAHLRLADLLLKDGQPDRATKVLVEARARFPGVPQLTLALGMAHSRAGRHDPALAAFELAAHEAHAAGRTDLLDAGYYFQYGAACEQAGRFERAAELLRKSIELDPARAASARNYLGYMWADRGENLDEAESLIRQALADEPDNAAFLDSLGWVLFRQGRYGDALRELLRAAERMDPPDAVVFDHLGDVYEKLGRLADALIWWGKALSASPGNGAIAAKIERAKPAVTRAGPEP